MGRESFWARLKKARAVQGLLVFLGASWLILQVLDILIDNVGVPSWTMIGAIVILGIGLVIQLAVVWVQALVLARREDDTTPATLPLDPTEASRRLARSFTWARFALGGIFAFALLFGLAGSYVLFVDAAEGTEAEAVTPLDAAHPGVAVLPFTVSGAQLDQIGDGLASLLSTNLDGAGGLRAIDSRTVLARWSELVDGDRADHETNLDVARATGARYALLGSAVAVGSDVRLQADVYDVDTGELLDRRQVEGRPDSVLTLVDRMSVAAIEVILGRTQTDIRTGHLAGLTTTSIPALKEFLDGEEAYRRSDFETARGAYQRAIEADSSFALAHYQLANTWGWTNGPGHLDAVQARRRAVELGDRLPERQALLVQATDELFQGEMSAIDKLRGAVARWPDHAEAWYLLGDAYFHLGPRSMASPSDMDDAFAQAVALDPKFAPFHIHLVDISFPLRDSAQAARRIDAYGTLANGSLFHRRAQVQFDLTFGDVDQRNAAQRELVSLSDGDLSSTAAGYLNACCWHAKQPVLEELRNREDVHARRYATQQFANGSMSHGQVTQALALYEDPAIEPLQRACTLAIYGALEFPIPREVAREALADERIPGDAPMAHMCRAMFAGSVGDWAEFDRHLASARAAEVDTDGGRYDAESVVAGLEGYRLWRRGQIAEAREPSERAFSEGVFAWWLGDVYERSGDDVQAARFYSAHYLFPLAYLELGKANERLGETEAARRAYETFLNAWEDADPEVQGWIDEAIDGIRRTTDPSTLEVGGADVAPIVPAPPPVEPR